MYEEGDGGKAVKQPKQTPQPKNNTHPKTSISLLSHHLQLSETRSVKNSGHFRKKSEEKEAYARATVALTRARKICVIFCPLDMKGLIGAATVMGSLMYGAGHCWNGMVNMHLRKSSLEECLSDNQFLSFLDHDDVPSDLTAQRRYPPVALIECVADLTQPHYKVRRLHLVIVDLWRPWKIYKSQVRSLTDQLRRLQPGPHADNTTPVMPMRSKTPLHGRRFVYGYSLDGVTWCGHGVLTATASSCWNRNLIDM